MEDLKLRQNVVNGSVTYLEITARRTVECKIMNPWRGQEVGVSDKTTANIIPHIIDRSNSECIVFTTEKGKKYLVNKN